MNRYSPYSVAWVVCLVLSIGLLSSCTASNTVDLESYVREVKARQHPRVEPLPEFVPYETFLYRAKNLRDPFTPPSLEPSTAVAQASGSGIHPKAGRRREPLESTPLDSLRMVGTLDRDSDTWALIRASDGAIHRIQPGNYLGQNHGKVTGISEYSVMLKEIVPDGLGGWIERAASLALSE
ncbi:MAG: pilus assembly protein PilP [Gammaproteobacteria bacterium]